MHIEIFKKSCWGKKYLETRIYNKKFKIILVTLTEIFVWKYNAIKSYW